MPFIKISKFIYYYFSSQSEASHLESDSYQSQKEEKKESMLGDKESGK